MISGWLKLPKETSSLRYIHIFILYKYAYLIVLKPTKGNHITPQISWQEWYIEIATFLLLLTLFMDFVFLPSCCYPWECALPILYLRVRDNKDMLYMKRTGGKNQCQLKQLAESPHPAHNKHTVNSHGAQQDTNTSRGLCDKSSPYKHKSKSNPTHVN